MELEDLQVLSLGHLGDESVDMALYDPMPGGSGLLDQIIERWDEVIEEGLTVVEECPSACERVCVDCLMTFRNMHYHRHLDRHEARKRLRKWGNGVHDAEDIEAVLPNEDAVSVDPASSAELLSAIFAAIGFDEPETDKSIEIPGGQGSTEPDFVFNSQGGRGVCVYLGKTEDSDEQARRYQLGQANYDKVEIPKSVMGSAEELENHLVQLAYTLSRTQVVEEIQDDHSWYDDAVDRVEETQANTAEAAEPNQAESNEEQSDGWEFIKEIVGDEWHDLADALIEAGVPEPDECLQGLKKDGRVSGAKAVFLWESQSPTVAVVSSSGDVPDFDGEVVEIDDDHSADDIAEQIRTLLN
jgi:hypothetical protein